MARTPDMNSASSQFFICDGDSEFLDSNYAAFGAVTSGIEVVHAIAALNTAPNGGPPSTPQVMKSVRVDTHGVSYPEPERILP
jgi:peptidyl-prolyl cis-trans isomerase B (cyclophilin B)